MMISVNLKPGLKRKGGGSSLSGFGDRAKALGSKVKDPLLVGVVASWLAVSVWLFGVWKKQTSELADLPMGWIFAAWPMAGFTWVVFLGERFVTNLRILAGGAVEAGA